MPFKSTSLTVIENGQENYTHIRTFRLAAC